MDKANSLQSILASFDRREKRACKVADPQQRYCVVEQLGIDAMKQQVQYEAGSREEQQIAERRQRYGTLQRRAQQEANRQVQRKYDDPFVIVQFDEIGALVKDQEALEAHRVLSLQYVLNNFNPCGGY